MDGSKKIISACLLLCVLGHAVQAADLAVVVSPDNPLMKLSKAQLENIFLGRTQYFPNGERAVPVDLRGAREDFYPQILGWSHERLKAHWSTILFTGRGEPPVEMNSVEEVEQFFMENSHSIGYVEKSAVSHRFKRIELIP